MLVIDIDINVCPASRYLKVILLAAIILELIMSTIAVNSVQLFFWAVQLSMK